LEEFGSGSFIQEFVSGGPKNYAFFVFCPSTGKLANKYNAKGISLKYQISKVVNITSSQIMILEDATPVHYTMQRKSRENIVAY
jgi:hypothetical protein